MISPIKEPVEFKAANYLKSVIPPGSIIDTFFFYGGKLEFDLAQSERIVRAHTNRYVIYEFWHCMQEDPERIMQIAQHLHERRNPIATTYLQDRWSGLRDHYVRAATFFLLNSYSKDGTISSGRLSFGAFSPLTLNRIKQCSFENLRINFYKDEKPFEGMKYLEGSEYIILPLGKYNYNLFEDGKAYGHETTPIDHTTARFKFDEIKEKAFVIYKSHPRVFEFYSRHNITMLDKYGVVTQNHDNCEEVVVANF